MIAGLVGILVFQGLGELVSRFLVPLIPGPAIGLLLLLAWLQIRREVPASPELVASTLTQHLGLLFVPAAVGVVMFWPYLRSNAVALAAALVGSVVLTIAVSVTAPIAMGVAERIHASPTLTAVFAITTGILGAVLARFVLNAVGSKAWWQRGFALGIAAHGIGTARAFSVDPEAGRFAGLAMGLHGILGAVLIPLVVRH